jgi:hypothetical protein
MPAYGDLSDGVMEWWSLGVMDQPVEYWRIGVVE